MNTEKRIALQKEWYARLAAEGFEDIETFDWATGEPLRLKQTTAALTEGRHTRVGFSQEKADYYYYAAQWANRMGRKYSARARKIWALHVSGLRDREIAAQLRLRLESVRKYVVRLRQAFLRDLRAGKLDASEVA